MAKAALPSLAASLLLHLVLSLGAGMQALRVSRAPLLPSRPTELELVPLDPAPPTEALRDAPPAGETEPPPVAEPAAPSRRSAALPAKPSLPPAPLPLATPASAGAASESPSAVSPGAVSEVAAVSAQDAVSALDSPSAALSASGAAEPGAVEPSVAAPGVPASDTVSAGTASTGTALGAGAAAAGTGRPTASAGDADRALRAAYLQELRRRVLGHRVYPYLARRARLEGTVCLRVSLNGQGQVARLQATCAAPPPLLEAAFAAVRTAAPFGPLPSSLGALTVDIPVVFQLEAL